MSKSIKKIVIVISSILILAVVLNGCLYWARLGFSENLRIKPDETIKIAMLISGLLKDKALTSLGQVNYYYYDAGDGPKPPREAINIMLNKEYNRSEIEQKVRAYFRSKGFVENDKNELRLDKEGIEITFETYKGNSITIAVVYH